MWPLDIRSLHAEFSVFFSCILRARGTVLVVRQVGLHFVPAEAALDLIPILGSENPYALLG